MERQAALFGLALLTACNKAAPVGGQQAIAAKNPPAVAITRDPTSPQAARDRVALYYKMIADKRMDAAQDFWADGPIARESPNLFEARFAGEEKVRAELGQPLPTAGAPGSITISIPVIVRGAPALAMQQPYELHRLVILRRPTTGSSPNDRIWRIQEVRDMSAGPEGTPNPIAF